MSVTAHLSSEKTTTVWWALICQESKEFKNVEFLEGSPPFFSREMNSAILILTTTYNLLSYFT